MPITPPAIAPRNKPISASMTFIRLSVDLVDAGAPRVQAGRIATCALRPFFPLARLRASSTRYGGEGQDEGVRTIEFDSESSEPPHPNLLPSGERELAAEMLIEPLPALEIIVLQFR